ncbi:hypothetical protein AArcMg_3025 [Natrarchaeobaculum sulfurireducens]|uniref:DUF5658 domain-containing protein n=1 Tax=Natrarchaeobaculum sulfurireducens TaxID=2044521 RepID=A0A346PU18_9EURY|nr:hypothetical protein AArc1_0678 [Natrarchaeobaculum sulfurireducens]AXR83013.1 hypothetical protein AArcMg_3025 [Natrarchaeobaculum sulfurireducens]
MRSAFFALWAIDLVAATLFFLVPYANELNPVTVLLYDLFGLPGVALAAVGYAGIVVTIGHYLSEPLDRLFVAAVVALYVVFVINNVILLVFRVAPITLVTM